MSLGDKHLTDGIEDPKERTPPASLLLLCDRRFSRGKAGRE